MGYVTIAEGPPPDPPAFVGRRPDSTKTKNKTLLTQHTLSTTTATHNSSSTNNATTTTTTTTHYPTRGHPPSTTTTTATNPRVAAAAAAASVPNTTRDTGSTDPSFRRWHPKLAQRLVRALQRKTPSKCAWSTVVHEQSLTTVTLSQLVETHHTFGSILAHGGFGRVRTVYETQKPQQDNHASPPPQPQQPKWVMKSVKPISNANKSVDSSPQAEMVTHIMAGLYHLQRELYFLSRISHPHIIALQAVSPCLEELQYSCEHVFLLLPYLPETLCQWMEHQRTQLHGTPSKQVLFWRSPKRTVDVLEYPEHMRHVISNIALPLLQALVYLHHQRIVYRDLKPSNVGFTADGILQLFDFGLATQLTPSNVDLNVRHTHLSGRVGTHRYMAPEVFRQEPYNVQADVFSFAIVLWEVLTLERPFDDPATMPGAAIYGDRPSLSHWSSPRNKKKNKKNNKAWPSTLTRILTRAWSDDLQARPHALEVYYVLQDVERQWNEEE